MANAASVERLAVPKSRMVAAAGLLVLLLVVKLVVPALILGSDLPGEWKAILSGVVFFGVAKLCLLAIVLVLGRAGFAYLKSRVWSAMGSAASRFAPAQTVGKTRYRIGLAMFILPLLVAWIVPHVEWVVPGLIEDRPYDWAWDLVFLASFIVLGGDFWDKLRSLFVHGARAQFPDEEPA